VTLADGTQVRVPIGVVDGAERIEIGVRPEKIRIRALDEPAPDGHNEIVGTVRDASYVGVSTSYVVQARGGTRLTVYEQNVERATRSELWAQGEDVRLSWSPDHTFAVPGDGSSSDSETA
jgi:spermidine/putrescine transport system ATP-binding protein